MTFFLRKTATNFLRRVIFKLRLTNLLWRLNLKPGDIAIDCGANVGNITAKLAKSGARVYAFEPDPHAFKILKKRFTKCINVFCLNQGVLDKDTSIRLYFHQRARENPVKYSVGSSVVKHKKNIDKNNYTKIEVIDFIKFIQRLKKPIKFVKMDIEGAEIPILNKLISTGAIYKIGFLAVETHERIPELSHDIQAIKIKIEKSKLTNIKLNWI